MVREALLSRWSQLKGRVVPYYTNRMVNKSQAYNEKLVKYTENSENVDEASMKNC